MRELAHLLGKFMYKPGWTFELHDQTRTLDVFMLVFDAYHPEKGMTYRRNHSFAVPEENWDADSWQQWLLEMCILVERHEVMEFFQVDGRRPYAPDHAPGGDLYAVGLSE